MTANHILLSFPSFYHLLPASSPHQKPVLDPSPQPDTHILSLGLRVMALSAPVTTHPPGISGRVWSPLCQAHQHPPPRAKHTAFLPPSLSESRRARPWALDATGRLTPRLTAAPATWASGDQWAQDSCADPRIRRAPAACYFLNSPSSGSPALGSEMSVVPAAWLPSEGGAGEPSSERTHVNSMDACGQAGPPDSDQGERPGQREPDRT